VLCACRGNSRPSQTQRKRRTTPTTVEAPRGSFIRRSTCPNATASRIKRIEDDAAAGFSVKVRATMAANTAITRISVARAKIRKKVLPVMPMFSSMISPIELPRCRMLATRLDMSCAPPRKIEPMSTQSTTGTQPKTAAVTGPMMGAAPAIEAK